MQYCGFIISMSSKSIFTHPFLVQEIAIGIVTKTMFYNLKYESQYINTIISSITSFTLHRKLVREILTLCFVDEEPGI